VGPSNGPAAWAFIAPDARSLPERDLTLRDHETLTVRRGVHEHRVAVLDLTGEQRPRQVVVDLTLHQPPQRARTVDGVMPTFAEPGSRIGRDREFEAAIAESGRQAIDGERHDLTVGRVGKLRGFDLMKYSV
jgi:hypothetical protein